MCGIAGIVSSSNITNRLLKALISLEYRGYDSCGIAIIENGKIHLRKDKGAILEVDKKHQFHQMSGKTGIAHTRWATTGIPNTENSHPHLSCNGDFALVHNGIISNYRELRDELKLKGHVFKSATDTEVLTHVIEQYFIETGDIELSIRQAAARIEGTYAIAMISTHSPENLYCARMESPLIIGLGDGENYLGSDFNAIIDYTRRVITLLDGEYAVLNHDTVRIKRLETGESVEHEIMHVDWDPELSKKGGFPHYMLKEIHEQPTTIETVLKIDQAQLDRIVAAIRKASRVYMIGVGTTYYVSIIAQYYFTRLTGRYLAVISSDEFSYVAEVDENTLVIAFSQSGETYDTLQALRFAKKHGAVTAGIINVLGSTMVREVDFPIMQGSGPEICVLSTKAALAQIIIAIRIALSLGRQIHFISDEQMNDYSKQLTQIPDLIRQVINESKGFINNIAKKYAHLQNWLFIGKSVYTGIALESALKMKEVSYRHAEGMPGGFMKHGTIALIEDGVGSIFFLPPTSDKELYNHTIANAEEIKARSGFLVGLGFGEKDKIFDEQVRLADSGTLAAPLLLMILGQLFAYYSAVALNRNVDKPRSLAKSVTVA
jgi:glutamine---fructose-6-phosphate transaminase (isomerizing)